MLSFSRYNQQGRHPHEQPSAIVTRVFAAGGGHYCTTNTGPANNVMCLDGGKLLINRADADVYSYFIDNYADDVANGLHHYLVEKNATALFDASQRAAGLDEADPVVNLFVELDIQHLGETVLEGNRYPAMESPTCFVTNAEWLAAGATPLDNLRDKGARMDFVRAVVAVMFGVIARSFCDQAEPLRDDVRDALLCIVADHEGDAKSPAWQAGIHLHFPRIRMHLSSIASLTHAMHHALQHHMPVGPRENPWSERLDRAAYRCGSGLRLVGSYKAKPCGACASAPPQAAAKQGKRRHVGGAAMGDPCGECMGVRFVHINRRYMPWLKLAPATDGGDPRAIPRSRGEAVARAAVVDEYKGNAGNTGNAGNAGNTGNELRAWVRLCSTKLGIVPVAGDSQVRPKGFVGDSTYVSLPSGVAPVRVVAGNRVVKLPRGRGPTDDTEFAITAPPQKAPSGARHVKVLPGAEALDAFARLAAQLPALFRRPEWQDLSVASVKYFARASAAASRDKADAKSPLYAIMHVKGQGARYCGNKSGYHSKNIIYFEVEAAQSVVENLLSSSLGVSAATQLSVARVLARITQRCFSEKQNGAQVCRRYTHSVEYPLDLEALAFPDDVKAVAASSPPPPSKAAQTTARVLACDGSSRASSTTSTQDNGFFAGDTQGSCASSTQSQLDYISLPSSDPTPAPAPLAKKKRVTRHELPQAVAKALV